MKTEQRVVLTKIPEHDGQMGIYMDGELAVIYTKDYDGDMQEDRERIARFVEDNPNCTKEWLYKQL